jgi:hypothetical protein
MRVKYGDTFYMRLIMEAKIQFEVALMFGF